MENGNWKIEIGKSEFETGKSRFEIRETKLKAKMIPTLSPLGERVDRGGAFISRRGTGEGVAKSRGEGVASLNRPACGVVKSYSSSSTRDTRISSFEF
jgi:hypothetical protein